MRNFRLEPGDQLVFRYSNYTLPHPELDELRKKAGEAGLKVSYIPTEGVPSVQIRSKNGNERDNYQLLDNTFNWLKANINLLSSKEMLSLIRKNKHFHPERPQAGTSY